MMGRVTTWTLGHRPALDGLRGVAILLVVVAHLGMPAVQPLGRAGVTVFFVLSGFLITSLLLQAHQGGRFSFRRFYWHRALRLLPAFLLLLVVVWPIQYLLHGSVPYWWATLLEAGNWVSATEGPNALGLMHHTWSLAIEEQFYAVWPLLVFLTTRWWGRRGVIVLASVGAGTSLAVSQMLHAGPRVSFGTDTNAAPLLAGCLLAALLVGQHAITAPALAAPSGCLLVGIGCSGVAAGWPVVAAGTVLLIWTVVTRGAAWLAWTPLRFAGRISYGWYLWNYPTALLLIGAGVSVWWGPGASLGLALLSWRYVEQPALRMKDKPRQPTTPATVSLA